MNLATEAEVGRLLMLVPEWRAEQARQYTHVFGSFCCLKSWAMLQELVPEAATESVRLGEQGKPYFTKLPLYFSISHCKNGIAVLVSERECGVDIESLDRKVSKALMEHTMSEEELHEIDSQPEQFIALWTRKEALLKRRGTGLTDELKEALRDASEKIETRIEREKGYAYSICE